MGPSERSRPPKVRITLLNEQHIPQMIKWRNQPEIGEHQPIAQLSRDQFLNFINSQKAPHFWELADREYILIIEEVTGGQPVGWMTLEISSQQHGLSRLGYSIGPEHWGHGYATAAVRTLLVQLFTKTAIVRVEADCSVHNPTSIRVLEKCGFRQVGIKKEYLVINGHRVDHYYYELLKKNFK
jgi:RimJ/RimL family protein N-acetyltransferase